MYIIVFIALSYFTAMGTLHILESNFDSKNGNIYFDGIGDEASAEKARHLELQKRSFIRDDNLTLYGSCELEQDDVSGAFLNKNNGFQVNKVGTGGTQSIIHAMNLGAIDVDITDKKIVIQLSESWFKEGGIREHFVTGNFSKIKFYAFLFNKTLSGPLKKRLAKRVLSLPKQEKRDYSLEIFYSKLYSLEHSLSNILLKTVHPFYSLYYKLLVVRDKYEACQKLSEYKRKQKPEIVKAVYKKHDWTAEKMLAIEKDKKYSNNEFLINDETYKNMNYDGREWKFKFPPDAPERDDFLIFLEVCKQLKVKPMIVYFPNHRKIFEHFVEKFKLEKSKGQQKELRQWVRDTVESYGFEVVIFSELQSADYAYYHYSHLGGLGLVHLNEAISKFYNTN